MKIVLVSVSRFKLYIQRNIASKYRCYINTVRIIFKSEELG